MKKILCAERNKHKNEEKKLIINHGSPEGSEYQKEKDLSTYNFIARKDSFQSQNKFLYSHKNSKRINQP